MPFTTGPYPGTLHHYAPRLIAFEHQPKNENTSGAGTTESPANFVLFLGGLGDALMTVRYPSVLAKQLRSSWSVAEVQLSSSGAGWATSSLERDADELAKAVEYFRGLAKSRWMSLSKSVGNIVLLGHSTGCQIAISYLIGAWKEPKIPQSVLDRPPVQGVILQAGISDREALSDVLSASQRESSFKLARSWIADGRGGDILPRSATNGVFGADPSAERWINLADPAGDDDLFSSDLSDARVTRIWGASGLAMRKVTALVMLGAEDEHLPSFIDKDRLMGQWKSAVKDGGGSWDHGSGVVPKAGHNLNKSPSDAVEDLCNRILNFIHTTESSAHGGIPHLL